MTGDLREYIEEAKEKLGDENATLIVDLLGVNNYNESKRVGRCANPNHRDSTPSFSYNPRTYMFHCFGCGYSVDVLDAYMQSKNATFIDACEWLFEKAGIKYSFADRYSIDRRYRYPKPQLADNMDKVIEYLGNRGISKETIDYMNVQQDKNGNVVFNYFNLNDVLCMVKIRKTHELKKGESKITALAGADTQHLLYGMNKINITKPLIICTGEIDALSCIEAGATNTVSIPFGDNSLQFVGEQWDFLQQFKEIIIVSDNDDSGRKYRKEIARRLGENRVKIAEVPTPYVDELTEETIDIKDVNDLLVNAGKGAVMYMINTAQEAEIESIVDYTDIKKFSMADVDGFKSGFNNLDQLIDKFYVGTTTLITGSGGSGKSSFLSTLICRAIEQGFPTFVFSGELNNESIRSWCDFVHCGQPNLLEFHDGQSTYYRIKPEAFERINQFYKGNLFFYRDGFDMKASSLLKTMEAVVCRKGVRFIVLDNMSVVDLENDDNNKWNRQDEFIREVIEFSKKWSVVICLVLHPRKMDTVRRMSIYDLQGVANAANLSHRVLSLYRCTDKDKEGVIKNGKVIVPPRPYDVILDILKDRYGQGQNKWVSLYYDVPSKRFFTTYENLTHQYGWNKDDKYDNPLPFGSPQLESLEQVEVYGEVI